MKGSPSAVVSPGKKTLRDVILLLIFFIIASLFIPVRSQGADYDVWWKMPGDRYWQKCTSISTDKGIGPVARLIPPGALIALRDKEAGVLVPITERRVMGNER